ncbi:hypothetical protein E2C01_048203 [Portunus trituberculatus]|uniref:Uncharacterized protein n=1 Tax=Portunus trituberculatus TaxID=210409 RepID=A0A5B7GCM4_PORTR|nr:hypothetical protein [Portunus trituberculatus]
MGGDKRLATRHGSHMADATINIPDRSLAARLGSCMADADLHILGSGHGTWMVVANPMTINSAESTKGTVHCLTCPKNRAWKPPVVVGPMADAGTTLTSGPATLAGPACPGFCIAPLVPSWEPLKLVSRNQRRENPRKRRVSGKASPMSPSSYTCVAAAAMTKGKTYANCKKKPSYSHYSL